MPALAGNALLTRLLETSAPKVRYIGKDGETIYKAEIVELFAGKNKKDGNNGARIKPLEGPSEGKTLFIPVDRLKGMPGRTHGFSPAKKDSPEDEAEESPKTVKTAKNTKPAKTEKKVEKKEEAETFDLESAREEMKDIAEVLSDLMERATALAAFMEGLEMGQEEESPEEEKEEETKPARSSKSKDKGKATRSSSKPRHDDDDEE